jgi:eukaryotic-like serine/threonine-protein kinase
VALAEQALRDAKRNPTTCPDKTPGCTVNNVMSQNPAAGQSVAEGSAVALTVCAAPDTVKIPDLKGYTKDAAKDALENLKLTAKFEVVDSDAPKDQVVRVPNAGKEVALNTAVVVEISNNKGRVVPNVVGRTEEAAKERLAAAGFKVNVEKGPESDDPGKVISQDPRANSKGTVDDVVTIEVTQPRSAPSPTPAPSVTVTVSPPGGGAGPGSGGAGAGSGGG